MKRTIASILTLRLAQCAALSLLAASCQFIPLTAPPPTVTPVVVNYDDLSIFKDGLLPSAQPILEEMEGASFYRIKFNIESDLVHITGSEEVRYTNNEETPLEEVHFRLFPNILGGNMRIANLIVDGSSVEPSYQMNDSLMIVPLGEPLQPGASTIISMDFELSVPETVELNYGVQAYYDEVLALAHGYPMIAVFNDEGWNAEIPPQSGDVTFADMSFFLVEVRLPARVTLVTSGRELSRSEDGDRQTVTVAAGPARDFYLAASPEYEVFTKEANGITFRFYTRDHLQQGAESALEIAARSVEDFGERYAPYPYTELDFVSTPTFALGIEYPGMIAITEWIVRPGSPELEATVAHEVAHQWFYNLVGNDQLDDPWLDESLAQFATLQYFTDEYGQEGNRAFRQDLELRWAYIGNEDIPVGLPVASYTDAEYSGIVYGRGALFFEALREEMGEGEFDAFMNEYVETLAWDITSTEKLKDIAEENCSCELTHLFEKWIY